MKQISLKKKDLKVLLIHYSFLMIFLMIFTLSGNAQTKVDSVLSSISANNKTILANEQFWEAEKLQYKVGLSPYNPKVDYDYLNGSPATAGNQTEFAVTQSFDFPTAYGKKKQLSNDQIAKAELQLAAARQEILLQARNVALELIYRNKLQEELMIRKQNTEKWLSNFQTRLDKGDGNILDVNKAKLQLIQINSEFQENISAINQLNQKLTELNGGISIILTDTDYPQQPEIPSFEAIENEIEAANPVRKYLEQEINVAKSQVVLSRAMSLPRMEAGYRYQSILGQTFQGLHVGMTIPLWENKNTVKVRQASLVSNELNLQEHKNEHFHKILSLYEKYTNLKITLDEYKTLFGSLNNTELLDKSLTLGQISSIEYFLEMGYYYDALRNYLKTERDYHQTVSELYKYKL
ncbi:TolC family protein [Algoriphagus aquimarinus]|uniref:TolC family protein n=1 Tax=Algoriphagus aquimarinus TaxID=237018 RepID=UPI001CB95B99|nr:TolC family protein [Algoriphagus aquimarinus]